MNEGGGERFVRHSGWRPWIIGALGIAMFGAIFLYWYIGWRPGDILGVNPNATTSSALIELTVQGEPFRIPANFTIIPRTRAGGEQEDVRLFALLPDLTPYTNADVEAFEDTGPESRVVYLFIDRLRTQFTESQRLERIFLPQVADRGGMPGPAGLTQYGFPPTSSYAGNDLFVGRSADGRPIVFRCIQPGPEQTAPDCFRETEITSRVSLRYQFKRVHLDNWRDIDDKVQRLIATFR